MAFLAIINRTQGGATFYVTDLNDTVRYRNITIRVDGKTSPNLAKSELSTVSNWWTVSTLSCGTNYSVTWSIESIGGSTSSGSGSFTTLPCDAPIGNVGFISAGQDSAVDSKLNINYGAATNADYYRIRLIDTSTFGVIRDTTESGRSLTFINVPVGEYIVQVWGEDYSGRSGPSLERVVTMINQRPVPGSPGYVSVEASTETAGRLYASWGSASGASDYLVTVYYSTGGYVTDAVVYGNSATFNGLIEGRTYYVIVVPRNNNGNGPSRTSSNITMPIVKTRPNNWQWDSTKLSGNSLNITASEWNRFLNRIDAFRSYKGLGSGSYTYASVSSTIAANQYNQARLAISSIGAVPYAVSSGSTIYASEFNQIRDYLNTIN